MQGGSVYDQSASALQGSGNAYKTSGAMYRAPGIANMSSARSANPAAISSGIGGYMNPYMDSVIDRSLLNINRMNDMQLNQVGADATAAGAFGGSRHGLVEAATNAESQRAMGDLSANLLNTGWNTAAGLSAQDIDNRTQNNQFNASMLNNWRQAQSGDQMARAGGLAQTGQAAQGLGGLQFAVGQQVNQNQAEAGSLQQQLIQQIMGMAGKQYEGFMGQPQNLLNMQLAALGMNPMTQATTTTGQYTPGLFDYANLGGNVLGAWLGRPG